MKTYWKLENGGIVWRPAVGEGAHQDDLEMSGLLTSYILTYGVDEEGRLILRRHCVWPTLRTIPNDTHASFQLDITDNLPMLQVDSEPETEFAETFFIHGTLSVASRTASGLRITRTFFPSVDRRNGYERVEIQNGGSSPRSLAWSGDAENRIASKRGTRGVYQVYAERSGCAAARLEPGGRMRTDFTYTAMPSNERFEPADVSAEFERRCARIRELEAPLLLDTGDEILDTLFRMCKIRAGESIFRTAGGLMHSPGGYAYYAATWCNDQVEYAGPWFACTGDHIALEASLNAYDMYTPFMDPDYTSIPSSIIAEKTDIWELDRGDEAMYAYGARLFALFLGDRTVAERLLPAIDWCLEYCERHKNAAGAVVSDTDELEGRFPSGSYNLSTTTLYYGGLLYGASLARSLGKQEQAARYDARAAVMREVIETVFGAELHGYATYRYYPGNETLRSWICLPLCMGIENRAEGTLNAMLSDRLWTDSGLLTEEGTSTVWDRSTLYGFRGAFFGDRGGDILPAFRSYCRKRLLGERVPYPVESYPEGGQRHLSGESCLFCRIITEGMFAIQPRGLRSFTFVPRVPEGLDHLILRNIHAFGRVFDLEVASGRYRVKIDGMVFREGAAGQEVLVDFEE